MTDSKQRWNERSMEPPYLRKGAERRGGNGVLRGASSKHRKISENTDRIYSNLDKVIARLVKFALLAYSSGRALFLQNLRI